MNGPGGKVEVGEDIIEAARRELREETGIALTTENMDARGVLHFHYTGKSEWNQDVYIFVSHGYAGGFEETEEMKPQWFDIDRLPFDTMWEDDQYWLPRVIDGEKVEFEFFFGKDGNIERYEEIREE